MASFDKYSNYTEETSFSSVIFGSDKPVLEVELNEIQQIIGTKISRILRYMGTKVLFLDTPTASSYKFNVPSALVFEETKGYIVEIKNASVNYSTTNKEIYIKLEEVGVNSTSELKSYGNTVGSVITNPIKDNRLPGETSRRKCIVYTLLSGSSVPNSTDTVKYVAIATSNSSGVLTYKPHASEDNLIEYLMSVNTTIENLKSGTIKAGDSSKLNGKSASSYCLTDNYKIKTFTNVNQLTDLTASTATPSLLWSTLPDSSMLMCSSTSISATGWNFPDTSGGTLTVVKITSSVGFIHFDSKTKANTRYYMLLNSSNTPTGTWVNASDGGNSATVNGFKVWTEADLPGTQLAGSLLATSVANQLPDKCIFYGSITADQELPKWFPPAITTRSWILTIIKHDVTRLMFSIDGMQDNSIHYVAGMNSGAWTGWSLTSNSVVVADAVVE